MVRIHLALPDRLITITLIEGRLLHVRVFLKRTIDFFSLFINMLGIYVMVFNPSFKNDKNCGTFFKTV